MLKWCLPVVLAAAMLAPLPAETRLDPTINDKIRQEAAAHSAVMPTLHMLTDVYGPRLTGSPNAKAAAEWAVKAMTSWGLENGHLEPWDFGRAGWTNERVSAHIVSPVKDQLTVEVLAWSPGTRGTVRASAFPLRIPTNPTVAELDAYFDRVAPSVKGAIVLASAPVVVPVTLNPRPARRDDAALRRRY